MAKFATRETNIHAPIQTTSTRVLTHEGGIGFEREPESALFLLAATNMVSDNTFYETGKDRDDRFEQLVHVVTATNPQWLAAFIPYLRDTMQMRSASIVAAAEYVRAGGKNGRQLVDAACRRADEPAEMIAYWRSRHGRSIPQPIKRGVADACRRLYTERNVLKFDGTAHAWRFADVIETVHAKPNADWQSNLWKYLLDARHHADGSTEGLPTLTADKALRELPELERRGALGSETWDQANWSWERLSGWLPGGMDAEAWEAVIPQMGYMALLRNLRNFDQAGVSDEVADRIMAKLADPEEVAKSRQFPIRFYSAFREIGSLRWSYALEKALDASMTNTPAMSGKTLVLIDTSASMNSGMSERSKRTRAELAALFGASISQRSEQADMVIYASGTAEHNELLRMPLLRAVETLGALIGSVGHGTETFASLARHYAGHDRVVILTDEQAHDAGRYQLPDVPIYTFNLAGYSPAHLPSGERDRYTFGGLTDAAFSLLPMLEGTRDGRWPFLVAS